MERIELKIARVMKHMSAREAAERIGCTRETLLNLENGKYRGHRSTWMKIAAFYGIPEAEIDRLRGPGKNKKKGQKQCQRTKRARSRN